jgi:Glycosyl hydrolases family 43
MLDRLMLLAMALIAALAGPSRAAAPPLTEFRPGQPWLDDQGVPINAHGGGILRHEGTYYWFGQHMVAGTAGNAAQVGVHVYSSKDLYNWKDEGIALKVFDDPANDITRGCILERPKVIRSHATGRFVMWFHLEPKGRGYSGARSGVAVADAVTGPYRFIRSFRPDAGTWPDNATAPQRAPLSDAEKAILRRHRFNGGAAPAETLDLLFRRDFKGGQMARDMTLYTDDDGAVYHLYASEENATLHISKLSDDGLRSGGRWARVFPGGFHEAPAVFKRGGKYWLITSGCSGWAPNAARLAVADAMLGPWKSLGNPCVGPDAKTTFHGQTTFILPTPGHDGEFIFLADRWTPDNAIDGRHLWLPIRFRDGQPYLQWTDRWDLGAFGAAK